jgi:hypothetical protein
MLSAAPLLANESLRGLRAAALAGILLVTAANTPFAATGYPKKAPKDGEVPHGKVVIVDDGKCPKGEVKEITGGSHDKGIPRKTRCIKRPATK